nr:zinc ABC transporter substrate-binding protein [uncultured Halomonas sp.]
MALRVSHYLMALLMMPAVAAAKVPSVAVDIPPVYSLVDQVMGDLGSPDLVIQQGASPHGYSLRPSEAAALNRADVVFWIGDGLTPSLADSLESLAGDAVSVKLMEVPGTLTLEYRQGATFDTHAHEASDDHGHEHAHHSENPHAWLDPQNAQVWLGAIAESLANVDPQNAAIYRDNARRGKAELDALTKELNKRLANAHDTRFVVFHDAYHYFENRFDISATGAISLGDASQPSPARLNELRKRIDELNIHCVLSEPQFDPKLVKSVFGDTGVETSIVIDPLGTALSLGDELYPQLLHQLADGLVRCREAH